MDIEKLKQWIEIAQNMQGGDFWKNIFDKDFASQFTNDQAFKPAGSESESTKTQQTAPQSFPLIDILEGEKELVVVVELAGIKKEDIQLGLSGDILTVKGIKKNMYPHLKRTCSEIFFGEFQRQIRLPDTISPNELNAKFWNGLLIVSYERTPEILDIIPIE